LNENDKMNGMQDREIPITVLMAVHNDEKYLRFSIESVLSQSFRAFEFLIINDASTDSIRDIICSFDDERIHLIDNQENLGLTASLNKGLSIAQGKYIARIDSDDLFYPTKLAEQYDLMENDPNVVLCGTLYEQIDSEGNVLRKIDLPLTAEENYYYLLFKNGFIHSSVMFRRMIVRSLGGYNEVYKQAQDHELWFRISRNLKVLNLDKVLVQFRVHSESISCKKYDIQLNFSLRVIKKYLEVVGKTVPHIEILKILQHWRMTSLDTIDKELLLKSLYDIHVILLSHAPDFLDKILLERICSQRIEFYQKLIQYEGMLAKWLVDFFSENNSEKIAFYAAGTFADMCLDILNKNSMPYPNVIFDQHPERAIVKRVRVEKLSALAKYAISHLIICHDTEHNEIYRDLSNNNAISGIELINLLPSVETGIH
jgi:glycosyltransferase involved in cell wall biosynthesis